MSWHVFVVRWHRFLWNLVEVHLKYTGKSFSQKLHVKWLSTTEIKSKGKREGGREKRNCQEKEDEGKRQGKSWGRSPIFRQRKWLETKKRRWCRRKKRKKQRMKEKKEKKGNKDHSQTHEREISFFRKTFTKIFLFSSHVFLFQVSRSLPWSQWLNQSTEFTLGIFSPRDKVVGKKTVHSDGKRGEGRIEQKNCSLVCEENRNVKEWSKDMIQCHDHSHGQLGLDIIVRGRGVSAEPSGDINQIPPSSDLSYFDFFVVLNPTLLEPQDDKTNSFPSSPSIYNMTRGIILLSCPFFSQTNGRQTCFTRRVGSCTESLSMTINLRFSPGVCFVIDFSNSFVTSTIEDELDDRDLFPVFVLEGIFNGYFSPLSLLWHREDLSWINVFTIQRGWDWDESSFLSLQTKERIMECPPLPSHQDSLFLCSRFKLRSFMTVCLKHNIWDSLWRRGIFDVVISSRHIL